ncbi:tRNAHis guanylyltransferase family protein [Trichomonas vaginalis G3]|uniref:tRNA(His) guanylyltransferase n=1 Tax=Trichomonas vaginalis (strain ATCC PRA-98 / G3) TaxID=412133 RepID=A2FE29_TRIV3|nr:tRNA guanylyltransferase protein [Trichomonas vaginalis G3]EAX96857.1 tRNAHis guanylyltransferase family protein [Trichomonas vaginalis G3]KAI5520678.1 tRNA guanylyltransferase protein [Trichomonas vaginalis G3]|eukprot:XP_001309787.1 tRNAHis guanylyltransferase family protein [Trichomonas vaginalis G3]
MACSKWEYVKDFELDDRLLPSTYIVVRVDGRGFTEFCINHNLEKPLDDRLIRLMSNCAQKVMLKFDEMVLAFGESDEFSFIFKKSAKVFNRRRDKINSTVASLFSSIFVKDWSNFFPNLPLQDPPSFDSRIVLYPSLDVVKDYLCWRQADTHINCLYNYTLNVLLRAGENPTDATEKLRGTFSNDKNEILFKHGINYKLLPAAHRKGTVWIHAKKLFETNDDLIQDAFWKKYSKLFE